MAHQAKLHIENQAWKELSDVLHTIKGSAGLAGKKNIANEAADLEVALETKECLSQAEFSALDNLIQALDAES
jgi:two-component system secretion sensor histidine kinase SsrA